MLIYIKFKYFYLVNIVMYDYLVSFLALSFTSENQLLLMFLSAFFSATILPGNSEIIFSIFASQSVILEDNSSFIGSLLFWATLGNTLGSMTTYFVAYLIPPLKFASSQNSSIQKALGYSKKYGVWVLLFSWLPIFGDIFCGLAGWLRFNALQSLILIGVAKGCRYGILLWGVYTFTL